MVKNFIHLLTELLIQLFNQAFDEAFINANFARVIVAFKYSLQQ